MELTTHLQIPLLVGLLLISALFSGTEVALFSLRKARLRIDFADNPLILRYLNALLDKPRRLLVTILLGNNIVNVAASILSVAIALKFARAEQFPENIILTAQIIILTILVLIFGEITPKVFASKNPVLFAKIVAVPMYWISVILYPVSEFFAEFINLLFSKMNLKSKRAALSEEDLSHLAELGHEKGTLKENEHDIIQSLVAFRSINVKEIMQPRVDITAISVSSSLDEVMNIVREKGHSRLPLYNNDLDEIIGIIHAKDLLPYIRNESVQQNFSLIKLVRKPMFVPENKLISYLMREFQEKKMHIAIVVDEYGGTAGLVTLEDIIEEIIGEIRDEFDKEETEITRLSDGSYLVDGATSAEQIAELLNINIIEEDDDFESIGGFILEKAGDIPKEGYSVKVEGCSFIVKSIENNRITKIIIRIENEG